MFAPGSFFSAPSRADGWCTCSRRSETIVGCCGSVTSMMRAAPTGALAWSAPVGERVVGVLVDLQQVVTAVAGERLRHLRDGVLGPGQVLDDVHLRVRLAVLDLADVEDPQPVSRAARTGTGV